MKILVVDDKEENLFSLEKVLEGTNIDIDKARSGFIALDKMLHETYSLVILDIQMPDMTGIELAEYMKTNEDTKNIPIIFVSALDGDNENSEKIKSMKGMVEYLEKPFDPKLLCDKVSSLAKL